ncbi:MAG: hypothetical protein ROO76_16795 [Terriglobia bacterium]|nr:hypothetical protein [Terriglobia bacterium]
MKYLIAMATALMALMLVGVPQKTEAQQNGYYGQQNWHGVLSSSDQQKFDDYYSKWVDATRKGDQDDIAKNARHMQDLMTRYRIPIGVGFDQIATNAVPGYAGYGAPAGAYPNNPDGAYPNGAAYPYSGQVGVRLSADDQQKFDKEYEKWMDAQRKNDRDDINKHAREMQDIMARYNIPSSTPFAAIATNAYGPGANGAAPYGYAYGRDGYAYGPGAERLSSKDQKEFDEAYHDWVDARRKKDMDDVDKNERKMREIMSKYNIPANVSFDQIASAGSAYR